MQPHRIPRERFDEIEIRLDAIGTRLNAVTAFGPTDESAAWAELAQIDADIKPARAELARLVSTI